MTDALVTFTPGQLVLIVTILAGALIWSVRSGGARLLASIDKRFDLMEDSIKDIRSNHPTSYEVNNQIEGVHRRISDFYSTRKSDSTDIGVS